MELKLKEIQRGIPILLHKTPSKKERSNRLLQNATKTNIKKQPTSRTLIKLEQTEATTPSTSPQTTGPPSSSQSI